MEVRSRRPAYRWSGWPDRGGLDRNGLSSVGARHGAPIRASLYVTDPEARPALAVPTTSEVASSLPSEAVQYDLENPPVPGSVQRVPEGA